MKLTSSILILYLLCFGLVLQAQESDTIWTKGTLIERSTVNNTTREILPKVFDIYELNIDGLIELLAHTTPRNERLKNKKVLIGFPNGKGDLEVFTVYEASVMSKELQRKFLNIRSYVGKNVNDPSSTIRFSISKFGLYGSIRIKGESFVIEPYNRRENKYLIYDQKHRVQQDFICGALNIEKTTFKIDYSNKNANDGFLRTYRIAVSATAEYSQFVLDEYGVDPNASDLEKKGAVLSELNNMITFLNSIFEMDLAVTLQLVTNNDDLIFFDSASDGFTHNQIIQLFSENQVVQDAVIMTSNYDIGHVLDFAPIGGIGEIAAVCNAITKARGVTGIMDLNMSHYLLFTHEIGHQFGGNHTFNTCKISSPATPGGSAVEPGSGSTIMAYPGSCDSGNNVQFVRDSYFNVYSLQEMWAIINSTGSCAVLDPIANSAPLITPLSNYTIPRSTPFALDVIASDAEMDFLNYTWEQLDAEIVPVPLLSTNTEGPAFRSKPPNEASSRYFPDMETVLEGNLFNTWEVLPSVARSMTFAATVRDNNIIGGQSASDDLVITVDDTSGPFLISSPAGFEIWAVGEEKLITWDVANTNTAPVNCLNVNIKLSVDGGLSYPINLASGILNDGAYTVTVPNDLTLNGRIKIESVGNVFYDVSTEIEISVDGLPTKTNIPDPNFEIALRYLGYDNDGPSNNGTVYKRDVVDITELNIGDTDLPFGYNIISDLTGIEDFENLVYLGCFRNQITQMDLSQNHSLAILYCNDNNLTSLDLSQNLALTHLNCFRNDLTNLNVKNGNNMNMSQFDARLNSELNCIEVDDSASANNGIGVYATWQKDAGVWYSESCAATTYIPDLNFEQYLIDNLIDSDGVINKNVFTTDISGISTLVIPNLGIQDLTGIEGFSNLTVLSAENNLLTTVDISNNVLLQSITFENNLLSTIDVSSNTNLIDIILNSNYLIEVDFANNINLQFLFILNNDLKTLDLSQNDQLLYVDCKNNAISSLDMKNGQNTSIIIFDATNNPDLYCVLVDDVTYSTSNWASVDAQTKFSDTNCNAKMFPKVFLQGAMLNPFPDEENLMRDDLRALGIIPLISPYQDAVVTSANVFNLGGSSGTGSINDDIVDWVFVEVRANDDNTNILGSQSALLQRDGDVVDIDGVSNLYFDLWANTFYIAIKHRNHLGVMSNLPQILNYDGANINFIDGSLATYGSHAQLLLGSGDLALRTGDVRQNGQIRFSGSDNDPNVIKDYVLADPGNGFNSVTYPSTGYLMIDVDLNGTGRFSGSGNDSNIIKDNVLAHPGNGFNSPTYVIIKTIPDN